MLHIEKWEGSGGGGVVIFPLLINKSCPIPTFVLKKKSPIALILTRSTIYNGVFSTLSMFYKLYKFKTFTFSTVDGEKKR